jgi:4'-phosphopantetheinyl transferase
MANILPVKIFFNLSHSHHLALFAVALEDELGIDIEWMNPNIAYLDISARFFSKTEHEQLLQTPAAGQASTFYRIWVRKEAYVKAIGEGLSHPLASFDVCTKRTGVVMVNHWFLQDINVAPDYLAALASPKESKKIQRYVLNFNLLNGNKSNC